MLLSYESIYSHLWLSFCVLENGHWFRVRNSVSHNSRAKHSSQVTNVHPCFFAVSHSVFTNVLYVSMGVKFLVVFFLIKIIIHTKVILNFLHEIWTPAPAGGFQGKKVRHQRFSWKLSQFYSLSYGQKSLVVSISRHILIQSKGCPEELNKIDIMMLFGSLHCVG